MVSIFDRLKAKESDEGNVNMTTDGITPPATEEPATQQNDKEITGKIIKLSTEGWGFISSREIPFTRIFFHWSGLVQNTLNFTQLKKGMEVAFIAVQFEKDGKPSWKAIKIKVINQ